MLAVRVVPYIIVRPVHDRIDGHLALKVAGLEQLPLFIVVAHKNDALFLVTMTKLHRSTVFLSVC